MNAAAYLILIINAASWASTDTRMTPFPSMNDCLTALGHMKTVSTASQAGDKSGMIAMAYCSPSPTTYRFFDSSGKEVWR